MSTALKSPIPLYLQMADALRQRITRGVWREGQAMPALEELAREFNVSRVTARQAVQVLTQEGLLTPLRGKGTFVNARGDVPKLVKLETSLADLARMYETTTAEILNIEEASRMPPLPEGEGILGAAYVHMRRVHFIDDQPYAVISLYLLKEAFSKAAAKFRTKAVIPVLLRLPGYKVRDASQTMTIGTADAEVARLLRISPGSPVAQVERVFKDGKGTVLYYADVAYRGDWVRWKIDLKP